MTLKKRIDPWIFISIILVVILSAFIIYDRSPNIRKSINDFFDIKEIPKESPASLGLTVLTDLNLASPPYDLNEYIDSLSEESNTDYTVSLVDINDDQGKVISTNYNLKTYPVLIFDKEIENTRSFTELSPFLSNENDKYLLRLLPYGFFNYPVVGDANIKGVMYDTAPVTIIEYGSYTCPYCAEMKPIFDQALLEFPDKIRFAYKHFSQSNTDYILANASECAGEQGKFWEMNSLLYERQPEFSEGITDELLGTIASDLSLDQGVFETCVSENRYYEKIKNHTDEAYNYALTGTPSIFINNEFIDGVVSYESLKQIINK